MQRPSARTAASVGAAIAVGVGEFAHRFLTYSGFSNDHFVHLATAQQMLLGEWPVRDYVERGIPLMSALSAAAQVVLGLGLESELVLIAAAYAAAAILTFAIAARLSQSVVIGVAAAAIPALVRAASYSYPKLLVYAAAVLAALWYCRSANIRRLAVLAGVVVGAFLFRHDHGVFLGAASTVMLLSFHGVTREAAAAIGRFVALAAVLVSPYVLWVEIHETFANYVQDGVAFSEREAERSSDFVLPSVGFDRSRPLFSRLPGGPTVNIRWSEELTDADIAAAERMHALVRLEPIGERTWRYQLTRWSRPALERLVRDASVADTHGIDRTVFRLTDVGRLRLLRFTVPFPDEGLRIRENAIAALFYICWLTPCLAIVLLLVDASRTAPGTRAAVLMIAAMQLLMNITMLRDPIDLRIRDVAAPLALGLAFVTGWAVSRETRMLRWMVAPAAVMLLLGTATAAAAVGSAHEDLLDTGVLDGAPGVTRRWAEVRSEFAPPRQRTGRIAESYQQLVDYVAACTGPAARLFAMTFAPELFFYTGRGFSGGQVTLTPGYYVTERHAALMIERLRRDDVPFVILDSETDREMAQHYPRVMKYVAGRYRRVAEFPISGNRRFIVLAESGRAIVSEYGSDRLPCYAGAVAAG